MMSVYTNKITLGGFGNTVNALSTPTVLDGPELITVTSFGITTIGSARNQTIIAGPGADTVTVGDADDNNTIAGSLGATTVSLGNGNNSVTLGGFGNFVKLGSGSNTVDAGEGSASVTIRGAVGHTDRVTARGWGDRFEFTDGTYILGGMSGTATINLTNWTNTASTLDLLNTTGDVITAMPGGLRVTSPNGSLFATITTGGANLAAVSDGNGGTLISLLAAPVILTGSPRYPLIDILTINGTSPFDGKPVSPFTSVTVTDSNLGNPIDTVTVTMTGAGGSFTGLGAKTGASYSISGSADTVQDVLRKASFTPAAGAPNSQSKTNFTLTVSSSAGGPAVNDPNPVSVTDNVSAAAPTVTGVEPIQSTANEAPIQPFAHVVIADTNAGNPLDTATITLSDAAGGTLADGLGFKGLTKTVTNGITSYTTAQGTASDVTRELQALVFTPNQAGTPPAIFTEIFTLDVASTAGTGIKAKSEQISVRNIDAAAPSITGTVAGQLTTSEAAIKPFSGVTITDPNPGGIETVTITVTGAGGTLTGADTYSSNVYTIGGTAADVTSKLHALAFTPMAGRPNTQGTTSFTLAETSTAWPSRTITDNTTTVINKDPAVAPTITGAVMDQKVFNKGVSNPFAGVVVSDANAGAVDTVTIRYDPAFGLLSGADLKLINPGLAAVVGTASEVTAQLHALLFAPSKAGTTVFTLSESSNGPGGWSGEVSTKASVIDTDTKANDTIYLKGWDNKVVAPATPATLSGPTTLTYTGWGNKITANALDDIIYAGEGSASVTVGSADGDHTISGSQGLTAVSLGNGNNRISLSGWANTVTLKDGNNYVEGKNGGSTQVTLGSGNNYVNLSGYANTIVVENSVAHNGSNFIVAGDGNETLKLLNSTNTVTLNGWGNLVMAGAGTHNVAGGNGTQFKVESAQANLHIMDFGTAFADVVDFHALAGLGTLSSVASAQNTILFFTPTLGAASQIADLRGTGGASLAALLSAGRVVV